MSNFARQSFVDDAAGDACWASVDVPGPSFPHVTLHIDAHFMVPEDLGDNLNTNRRTEARPQCCGDGSLDLF